MSPNRYNKLWYGSQIVLRFTIPDLQTQGCLKYTTLNWRSHVYKPSIRKPSTIPVLPPQDLSWWRRYFLRGLSSERRRRYTSVRFSVGILLILLSGVVYNLDGCETKTWRVGGLDNLFNNNEYSEGQIL